MWERLIKDRVKEHIVGENAYNAEMKAALCGLVEEVPAIEVTEYFNTLVERINASPYRSRELCKWLHRVLYEWHVEKEKVSEGAQLTLLENILLGRKE